MGLFLFAPLAWLLLLNFHREEIGPGLDTSAVAVLTRFLAEGKRFGPDVVFNYGPLAVLAVRTWDGRLFGALFVGELVLKAAFVVIVLRLAWTAGPGRWLLVVTVLVVGVADWQALFFLAAVGAGLVLAGRERADRWLTLPALGLLAALALVKGTLLVLATLAAAAGALAAGSGRAGNWRRGAWRAAGFAAALLGVWMGVGQRAGDLPAFVRGTLDIAAGYSRGLSYPPPDPVVFTLGGSALAVAASQIILLAWAGRRDRATLPLAGLLGAALFLAWKQGFTRADGHVVALFAYATLSVVAAPAFFPAASRWLTFAAQVGALAATAGLATAGCTRAGVDPAVLVWRTLRERAQMNPTVVRAPRAEADRARAELAASRRRYALPRIRAAVAGASVDFFGFEQGVLLANGLRYAAPPVPQGYQVNTPLTQRLNQDFYRGPRAPEFVVFKLQPMDSHPPTAENAGVLVTLALDYAPVLSEKGYLLLRRVGSPLPSEARPLPFGRTLAEGDLPLDGTLSVPAVGTEETVWCELTLRESFAGRLRATVYQQQPVHLEVFYADRPSPSRYRLVPGMVATGFLLSPRVDDEAALTDLQAGRPVPGATALRLAPTDGPWLARQFQPRWGYRLRALPRPEGAVREAAARALTQGELGRYGDIATPGPTRVFSEVAAGTRFRVGEETFLFVHPPGEMELPVPAGATRARGRFTFEPRAWQEGKPDGVLVRVDLLPPGAPADAAPQTLFSRLLLPGTEPADREVGAFDVPLPPDAAGGRLFLRTLHNPATGNSGRGWFGWSAVRVE